MPPKLIKNLFLVALLGLVFLTLSHSAWAATDDVFGSITIPEPLRTGYGAFNNPLGGLVGFLSNLIKLIMVVAGIWSFLNIILAGFAYIANQGNPEAIAKANQQIYMSLVGLVVVVGSFVLAAILGWILFGDASAILSPKIYGPGINGTPAG